MTAFKVLVACSLAAVASGCATSGFVSSWKAPDAAPLQVQGSMVAAIAMIKDEASRRSAEDALVRELNARGAMGVAMYTIMPDTEPANEPAVRRALEQRGYAGVVVLRPVRTDKEIVGTPPVFTGPNYRGFWGGYFGYGWRSPWGVADPGSVHTNTIVSVETLVYSLRQNMLVWGGESQTTNPASIDRLVQDTAKKVARELERLGLLSTS